MEVNRVFRKSLRSKPPGHLTAEDGADDAIGIAYIQSSFDLFPPLQSRRGQIEQNLIIERVFKPVVLRNLTVASDVRANLRPIENRRVVQTFGLPMLNGTVHFQLIRASNHLVCRLLLEKKNDVEKLDGGFCWVGRGTRFGRLLEEERRFPAPERRGERVEDRSTTQG